jgi:ASC-1-like (ASCH) protein
MIENAGLERILPFDEIKTIDEGVKIYHGFYTEEQEKEFGAIGIEIKVV